MANSKISALTSATTVAGTEVLPIVQSSATVKVSIANLTPGLDTITAVKGGTGQTSYAVGDLLYANTTTTLAKLADVATGNALISGGVSTAPSWGKIGLTTHVSGTLPTANGGTNLTSFTANGLVYASSTSALATGSAITFDGTNFATTGTATAAKLIPTGTSVTGNGMYLPAANSVGISTAGVNAVYIDANQNVQFGIPGATNKRVAAAVANNNTVYYAESGSSYAGGHFVAASATTASTGWYHMVCQSGGAVNNLLIYGNGDVVNANNSYGPISDIKVKENITDTTPKLNKLMQVRVVNYNLKGELGYETHNQIGVIAQELETVFPGLVEENPDRDANGNDLGTTTKSVKMSVFVPILIKALQELSARVTELETK